MWQPIETAPRDKRILLSVGIFVGSGKFGYCHPWGISKKDGFYFEGCDMPSGATHWMPLPDPPSTERDNDEAI